jgi:predicted nucleic acid-binding protein
MSGNSRFVDTNILLYARDPVQGRKHDIARLLVEALWNSRTGVVSTQVLEELCFNLRRKTNPPCSIAETVKRVRDFLDWRVVTNIPEFTIAALELGARYQLSFWDALIVHAAQVSASNILYTEDLSHGQIFGSVRVVNPFLQT